MNREYVIITDPCCDLPEDYLTQNGLVLLPMPYTIESKTYTGEGNDRLTPKDFYAKMRAGNMPITAQVTPEKAMVVFEGYLKQGIDVLCIAFSSALSGTYNSERLAAQELSEKYPDSKVYVVDSLCASLGEGLLIDYAVRMKLEGNDIDTVRDWLEENKGYICHNFTVDDLFHLHRGGRVSKAAAIFGSMLNVKPVLHVDDEGRLIPIAKVRGRKQSLNALVDNMEKQLGKFRGKNPRVFISHGDCEADAQYVADRVKERCGVESFLIKYIGPIIGAHSGPGTVALFFLGEER